jgi:hypothetical protein
VFTGKFIVISGANLASTAAASQLPMPRVLGGSCVTLGNLAIPLLQTSAGQITAQLPSGLTQACTPGLTAAIAASRQGQRAVVADGSRPPIDKACHRLRQDFSQPETQTEAFAGNGASLQIERPVDGGQGRRRASIEPDRRAAVQHQHGLRHRMRAAVWHIERAALDAVPRANREGRPANKGGYRVLPSKTSVAVEAPQAHLEHNAATKVRRHCAKPTLAWSM